MLAKGYLIYPVIDLWDVEGFCLFLLLPDLKVLQQLQTGGCEEERDPK